MRRRSGRLAIDPRGGYGGTARGRPAATQEAEDILVSRRTERKRCADRTFISDGRPAAGL